MHSVEVWAVACYCSGVLMEVVWEVVSEVVSEVVYLMNHTARIRSCMNRSSIDYQSRRPGMSIGSDRIRLGNLGSCISLSNTGFGGYIIQSDLVVLHHNLHYYLLAAMWVTVQLVLWETEYWMTPVGLSGKALVELREAVSQMWLDWQSETPRPMLCSALQSMYTNSILHQKSRAYSVPYSSRACLHWGRHGTFGNSTVNG